MSYILEALRKSEQNSRNQQPPTPDTIQLRDSTPEPKSSITVVLVSTVIILAGSGFAWMLSDETPVAAVDAGDKSTSNASNASNASNESIVSDQSPPTHISPAPLIPTGNNTTPPPPDPVDIAELPISIQQQIPELRFSSHIYSDDPRIRMVNINGRNYREGDSLGDDLRILTISEQGIVLRYLHYTLAVSVLRDWAPY